MKNGMKGLSVWALAFGCVIGWGSFVMPGTTFLPGAGPVGSALGIALAGAMIVIVGVNYSQLAQRYPDNGGSYSYVKNVLGSDHAFLAVWALALAYLSLLWANATAFILIGRYLLGDALQWGFHYSFAGYDIYFGEVIVTIIIQTAFGFLSCYAGKAATAIRTALAALHFVLIILLFFCVLKNSGLSAMLNPAFAVTAKEGQFTQILDIAVLAPWMFVGFETASQEVEGSSLSVKRTMRAAIAAIICGMTIYILLTFIAATGSPESGESWVDYIANLGKYDSIHGMPTLAAAEKALGPLGIRLIGLAVLSTLSTSVLGFYHASANIISLVAADGLLPKFLAKKKDGVPQNAVWAIMIISLPIPFLGRTAVGWNADVSTLSVAIVYAYISIAAYHLSKQSGKTGAKIVGVLGTITSIAVFFLLLVPNILFDSALATESYLMLAGWSLAGIVYYWYIFRNDSENRFGQSTAMWIMMSFILFFSANVWLRLNTQGKLRSGVSESELSDNLTTSSLIMIGLAVLILLIMFSLFSIMLRRQKELDLKVIQAEERDSAKTSFLSNMSHDIRTPMNAIVGFTDLAIKDPENVEKTKEYLGKIKASSNHLLSLINDVLEMSRIESGKIELNPEPVHLPEIFRDLETIITGQVEAKKQSFSMDLTGLNDEYVYCDRLRLNQVLLNLLSNAVKYTQEGGEIKVSARELSSEEVDGERFGRYEIRVKDNGMGMTPEFAAKVFEAFERENNSSVSGIQGTGLGMAITKRIVDIMGGEISVETEKGKGSEFMVTVTLRIYEGGGLEGAGEQGEATAGTLSFEGRRLLLTDDVELNRELATIVLEMNGFEVEQAADGQEAFEMVSASEPGYYDAVLMDIQMPRMNGYEATRAIRALENKELASIPIIAMTANAFDEDRRAALEAGMNSHLAKPIDADKLMAALQEAFLEKEAADVGTYVI